MPDDTDDLLTAIVAEAYAAGRRDALAEAGDLDDGFIVPSTIPIPPERGDATAWLQISQVTLHNVRSLVNSGKSETADRVIRHYWRRWREWS